MYRQTLLHTVVSDDSNQTQIQYDRQCVLNQTKDLQFFQTVKRINVSDAEAQVPIAPVTNAYFLEIRSDYPVMVRLNGASATQFTLKSNNVQPVNVGAPLPDNCVLCITALVTSVYLAPISGATQVANVKVTCSGDPTSSYV